MAIRTIDFALTTIIYLIVMSSTFNIGNGMIVMKGYITVGAILAYCICALLIKYTTLYKFSIKKLFYESTRKSQSTINLKVK